MTELAKAKVSFVDELKALNFKQVAAILAALLIAVVLQTAGFAEQCMGFLIIGAILYMVPHLMKVTSVKIKGVLGVIFVVLTLITSAFVAAPSIIEGGISQVDIDKDQMGNVQTEVEDGNITVSVDIYSDKFVDVTLYYGEVTSVTYKTFVFDSRENIVMDSTQVSDSSNVKYHATATVPVKDHDINGYQLRMQEKYLDDNNEEQTNYVDIAFFVDTGASNGEIYKIGLSGLWVYVAFTAAMFFMILIFSALMRRSAEKSRKKMEAEGRLYPKGYGRCKNCGAMVLPGEVNCRKCGAYIDVPEELRAEKKDYFICEECGAEVPNDAEICPKCGAKFDTVENEVVHADGSVDLSEDTFECPECGEVVPANATRGPKCGAKFDEDSGNKDTGKE